MKRTYLQNIIVQFMFDVEIIHVFEIHSCLQKCDKMLPHQSFTYDLDKTAYLVT